MPRPLLAFVASVAFLAYALGYFTSFKNLPPNSVIVSAHDTAVDLWLHWKNDLGLAPTRLLVPAARPERDLRRTSDPARAAPGYRFIAALTPKRDSLAGALLLDQSGRELHYWPIDYGKLAPGGLSPSNVYLHGTMPLPDGSLIVVFDNGDLMARLGPCGEALWVNRGQFHHALGLSDDGTAWAWEYQERTTADGEKVNKEMIVQVELASGRRLRQISLEDDIVDGQALHGRFAILSQESAEKVAYCCDHFHPNDVKPLPPALAPAFPMFRPGDLLISLRSLNMIAVIDPGTAQVKWSQIGPWHRQHDPDFMPDGTISVLNNNMGLGASQIVVVDPKTGGVRIAFDGATRDNFYTWRRGRHQWLPNGNIMIAETEKGRAIEVDPTGEIVWQYNNVFDEARNGVVSEALGLPSDFFAEGALSCAPSKADPAPTAAVPGRKRVLATELSPSPTQ